MCYMCRSLWLSVRDAAAHTGAGGRSVRLQRCALDALRGVTASRLAMRRRAVTFAVGAYTRVLRVRAPAVPPRELAPFARGIPWGRSLLLVSIPTVHTWSLAERLRLTSAAQAHLAAWREAVARTRAAYIAAAHLVVLQERESVLGSLRCWHAPATLSSVRGREGEGGREGGREGERERERESERASEREGWLTLAPRAGRTACASCATSACSCGAGSSTAWCRQPPCHAPTQQRPVRLPSRLSGRLTRRDAPRVKSLPPQVFVRWVRRVRLTRAVMRREARRERATASRALARWRLAPPRAALARAACVPAGRGPRGHA